MNMKKLRSLSSLVLALVLVASGADVVHAFQVFVPGPAGGFYIANATPLAQPPFVHWDLRKLAGCQIPWSVRFPAGVFPPLDVNHDGANNNAADRAAVTAALTGAVAAWTGVAPSIVDLTFVGPVPGAQNTISRDQYDVFGFDGSVAADDTACAAPAGPFHPVVAPGPDGLLHSSAMVDDMILPCIVNGADANSDTTALADDVQIIAAGGAVPNGCNVIITAGPNGRLDTPANNAPAGVADDRVSACIVAGPNGVSDTPINNTFSGGAGAITGIFFNPRSGVILESDVEFGLRFWSVNGNGQTQLQGITAGPNGVANSAAAGDDVQNIPQGTGGLNQNAVIIGPGPNRVINTPAANDDVIFQSTDIQMIATHELGHTLGIAHPVDGRDSNDVQVVAPPGGVAPGGPVVTPGPGGQLDTQPQGDDEVSGNTIIDGGNGTAETYANNAQTMNDTMVGATNNIMNPFFSDSNPTNHTLSVDDETACNWLYTPDLGDAPDQCPWPPGAFNKYQSKVHTTTPSGDTLNAVNLFDVGKGPVQLFGYRGPAAPAGRKYRGLRFEWLGADMDDHPAECEARLQDADSFDDGAVFPKPFKRGMVNHVTITFNHTNAPGRYDNTNAERRLYVNAYFDFPQDCLFDPGERDIWWNGVPGMTNAASPNWTGAAHVQATYPEIGTTTLEFDLFVPANAKDAFYCRFRLDYGEDEARVKNVNGDLTSAEFVAQYGEVEDYLCTTVEVDEFLSTVAEIDLRMPPTSTTPHLVTLTGPATVHVDINNPLDTDGDGKEQVTTSMERLQLSGFDPTFGTVLVGRRDPALHPFQTSVGEIEEDANNTFGVLDLPPFVPPAPERSAQSFFNIFFDVTLPNLAVSVHSHSPKHMLGTIHHKPPNDGDTYVSPDWVPLYDAAENLVAVAGPGYHAPDNPTPDEIDNFPSSLAEVDVRFPAGSGIPRVVRLDGPSSVSVDLAALADSDGDLKEQVPTEMLRLGLEGSHPDLGTIRVRTRPSGVHPYQRSTGEIEEDANGTPGLLDIPPFVPGPATASTAFDIWPEVEMVNFGLVLHTHQPKHMTGTINHKPPAPGDTYTNPLFIPLFDDAENLVAEIGPGYHTPNPTPSQNQGACCLTGSPSCFVSVQGHCTALGGDWQGVNTTCAGSCAPSGPPGVTNTLRVTKLNPAGSQLLVFWNGSACETTDYQLVFGGGSQLPTAYSGTYNIQGAVCSTGGNPQVNWNAPDPAGDPKRFLWFLAVAHGGPTSPEGAWGKNSGHLDRKGPTPSGASGICHTNKDLSNGCGQVP